MFIPVFINVNNDSLLLFNENPFYNNWNKDENKQFLLNYILQNEDLDDYKLIQERINFIENYDFKEITSKYELNESYIIFIVLKDNNNFKTFSKLNIETSKSNFKKEFDAFEFDNVKDIEKLVRHMKVIYDDEWKKINLINSSIKLNIELDLSSKDIFFIEKVEKILNKIDLIEKFNVSYFNNEITRYSILSNATPDKLINEFEKFNIKVNFDNNIWTLNE